MIQIENLVKEFGSRRAVDQVSLDVERGEIFGLLGPNGAGKTTIIRILTMLIRSTDGTVTINGCRIPQDEQRIKALIGIVPQHVNLDPDLCVWENLDLQGRLHHLPKEERQQRIAGLLAYVEMADRARDKVQTLSGGMKRRVMIARALLHRPQILFLDEPTVGLDPQVRRRLWDLIRRLNQEQLTVLLTTHYIEEAENLCNRVAILEKGKLITLDNPAKLCEQTGEYVVEWLTEDHRETRFFRSRSEAAQFAGTLMTTATIRCSNLEDVFVKLTGSKVIS